jgi:hypothetical protein
VGVRLGVEGAVRVGVASGGVLVRVRVAVGVAETRTVEENVGVGRPGVGVKVAVGERRAVLVGVAVFVGKGVVARGAAVGLVWVRVALGLWVGVARVLLGVGVARRLRVGVAVGVKLGARCVGVGEGSTSPTRTTSCRAGPRFPATSRNRTVRRVSPGGNAQLLATVAQNWIWLVDVTSAGWPCVLTVQAPVASAKLQPRSLRASETNRSGR